ncbi:META domain-containing protein [Taibaiella chishuiensis]|uniref:Uncharacterized protein n=1 Tax=Taibaiella chishuiensis TaxID=1434707 RepID=A0A2P8CT50_9BACT|nr:META domain-containing protein [Taibaiella chishuiensis]PSK88129.1 hypothetical protein B0I18_11523 [Taibaiella chishuiensis]
MKTIFPGLLFALSTCFVSGVCAQEHLHRLYEKISGIFWKAAMFEDTLLPPSATASMSIFIQEDRVLGYGVCNNISGYFTVADTPGTRIFTGLDRTRRDCGPDTEAEFYFIGADRSRTLLQFSFPIKKNNEKLSLILVIFIWL